MKKGLLIAILFSVFACKENTKAGYVSKNENGGDEVYTVEDGDLAMNLAIAKAKGSYDNFLEVIKNDDSTLYYVAVKMKFETGDGAEHMWVNQLYSKDNKVFGVLDSDPVNAKSFKAGDSLEVKKELISDWMYVKDNKLVGGYTIKALYSKMDEQEKKEFKDEMGFEIE